LREKAADGLDRAAGLNFLVNRLAEPRELFRHSVVNKHGARDAFNFRLGLVIAFLVKPAKTKSGGFFMIGTPTCATSDEVDLLENGNGNDG
jgi:hypothetical protein